MGRIGCLTHCWLPRLVASDFIIRSYVGLVVGGRTNMFMTLPACSFLHKNNCRTIFFRFNISRAIVRFHLPRIDVNESHYQFTVGLALQLQHSKWYFRLVRTEGKKYCCCRIKTLGGWWVMHRHRPDKKRKERGEKKTNIEIACEWKYGTLLCAACMHSIVHVYVYVYAMYLGHGQSEAALFWALNALWHITPCHRNWCNGREGDSAAYAM